MAYEHRAASESAVSLFICGQIAGLHGTGQRQGLAEGEAETFAGDGVDAAGGVTEERDVASLHVLQRGHDTDGAARAAEGLGMAQSGLELRQSLERGGEVGVRGIARHYDDADFFRRDGCDVGLDVGPPENLGVGRPGFYAEVLAHGVAFGDSAGFFESGPAAYAGALAVGADDPAGGDGLSR